MTEDTPEPGRKSLPESAHHHRGRTPGQGKRLFATPGLGSHLGAWDVIRMNPRS